MQNPGKAPAPGQTLSKLWVDENREWLTVSPFANSKNEFWCKYCKACIKPKKYNVQMHAKTKRHKIQEARCKGELSSMSDSDSNGLKKKIITDFQEMKPIKSIIMKTPVLTNSTSGPDGNKSIIRLERDVNNPNQRSFILIRKTVPESNTDIDRITEDVTQIFKRDLRDLLTKNESIMKPLIENPDFFEGEEGLSRLTKLLVGHMAQHYLIEYTEESYKTSNSPFKKKTLAEKLNAIEQIIEKSVLEMQNVKAELENVPEPENMSITLEGINVEVKQGRNND